jgi:hypothetical protein
MCACVFFVGYMRLIAIEEEKKKPKLFTKLDKKVKKIKILMP